MSIYTDDLTEEQQIFVEQLERDKTWALQYYGERDNEFQRVEQWYFKEHYEVEAELPPDAPVMDEATDEHEHLVTLPIPTNIINSIHGVFTDEEPYIQCVPTDGRKSRDRANEIERFLHGVFWINRQTQGVDPREEAALDMLIYGWACLYTYWDVDRAELMKMDATDYYAFPLVVKRINPRDVRPLLGGNREQWKGVIYNVMRTKQDVEDEWGVEIEPLPYQETEDSEVKFEELTPESMIEYVDYWLWKRDKDMGAGKPKGWQLWNCVMAHEQIVKEPIAMPDYDYLPYEIFFCRKSPSLTGSKMGLSFLYTIIEPVQELEYLINRLSRMVEMYADPVTVIEGASEGAEGEIEKGPGTVIYVDQGGGASYLSWAGAPPEINQLVNLWKDAAQDSYPPVMSGMQGGTSGLDTVALQAGGKLQTNKPRRNYELALQRVNTKIIRLLQNFSPSTSVFAMGQRTEGDVETPFTVSLKGQQTKGYENTIVTVRGRFPREEIANVAMATAAVSAGLLNARDAAGRYLFIQDPDRNWRMWLEERQMQNPEWAGVFAQGYWQLPTSSPISDALEQAQGEEGIANMAGADTAAAVASTPEEAQSLLQRTPVESNVFSAIAGGQPHA